MQIGLNSDCEKSLTAFYRKTTEKRTGENCPMALMIATEPHPQEFMASISK